MLHLDLNSTEARLSFYFVLALCICMPASFVTGGLSIVYLTMIFKFM